MEKSLLGAMQPLDVPSVMVPRLRGMEFIFICSADWSIDWSACLRTKIEHGMLHVKPSRAATGFQDIPATGVGGRSCKAVLSSTPAYVARVAGLLRYAGWTTARPCFGFQPAMRGWYGITPPARPMTVAIDTQGDDLGTLIAPCVLVHALV